MAYTKRAFICKHPGFSRLEHVNIPNRQTFFVKPQNEMRGVYFDKPAHLYYFAVRFSDGIYVLDTNFQIVRIIPGISCVTPDYRSCGTDKITKDGSGAEFGRPGGKLM